MIIGTVTTASAAESTSYDVTFPSRSTAFIKVVSFTPTNDGIATLKGYQYQSGTSAFSTFYRVTENGFDTTILKQFNGNRSVAFDIPVKSGNTYAVLVSRMQINPVEYNVYGTVTYP